MTIHQGVNAVWRRALLAADATVQEAVLSLNQSGLQIAVVVNADGVLIGTITDGDVRRGLLRGVGLESPIDSIIYRDALVAPPSLSREAVLGLMTANEIHGLPVVDGERRVVGLHVLRDLLEPVQRANMMVIMAGGEGRRLMPHTEMCPKPLLPVGGKPMLELIIERAKSEGFTEFVIAINYLGHMIENHFGDGSRWGVRVSYLRERTALGTAGALALLDPRPALPILVSNGDVLTDVRYGELLDFHVRHATMATMAVRLHEWQHPFGVVHTRGVDILSFEEKPMIRHHINAGIYALEPRALDALEPERPCDMTMLFARLQEQGHRTIAYPMHEPWLDLGLPDDFERARAGARQF